VLSFVTDFVVRALYKLHVNHALIRLYRQDRRVIDGGRCAAKGKKLQLAFTLARCGSAPSANTALKLFEVHLDEALLIMRTARRGRSRSPKYVSISLNSG
jgi:hypothetical protein